MCLALAAPVVSVMGEDDGRLIQGWSAGNAGAGDGWTGGAVTGFEIEGRQLGLPPLHMPGDVLRTPDRLPESTRLPPAGGLPVLVWPRWPVRPPLEGPADAAAPPPAEAPPSRPAPPTARILRIGPDDGAAAPQVFRPPGGQAAP